MYAGRPKAPKDVTTPMLEGAGREASADLLQSDPSKGQRTQPLEPILFPKLRIYFADFPYLHCSINQRLFTLETCCGYEYDLA